MESNVNSAKQISLSCCISKKTELRSFIPKIGAHHFSAPLFVF